MQKVISAGSEGVNDYSRWTFTYTDDYHTIVQGANEITSKISWFSNPNNLTKWHTVNVTGLVLTLEQQEDSSQSALTIPKIKDKDETDDSTAFGFDLPTQEQSEKDFENQKDEDADKEE